MPGFRWTLSSARISSGAKSISFPGCNQRNVSADVNGLAYFEVRLHALDFGTLDDRDNPSSDEPTETHLRRSRTVAFSDLYDSSVGEVKRVSLAYSDATL